MDDANTPESGNLTDENQESPGSVREQGNEDQQVDGDLQQATEETEISSNTAEQVTEEEEITSNTAEQVTEETEISSNTAEQVTEEEEITQEQPQISSNTAEQVTEEEEITSNTAEQVTEETEISSNTAEQVTEEEEITQEQPQIFSNTAEDEPEDSEVYTATSLSLVPRDNSVKSYPLTLDWAFGMNKTLPVFNLVDQDRLVILYACSNVAVIYDHTSNSQHLLQGHCSLISCLCVSDDRRWIVTADKGHESLVIIWDSYTGIPVRTMFECHPEGGVAYMALSRDSKYIVTIGAGKMQRVCIWDWVTETKGPECEEIISPELGLQNYITFNPADSSQLLSNSEYWVICYTWDKGHIQHSVAEASLKTFKKAVGSFSQSVFHFGGMQALSVTLTGNLLVWDIVKGPDTHQPPTLKATRLIPMQKVGITVIMLCDSFIVTGDLRGLVKFYDENFKFISSYSKISLDPIASISFSKEITVNGSEECQEDYTQTDTELFFRRNIVLSTGRACVIHVNAQGSIAHTLLKEHDESLTAVACHPKHPLVAMGSHSGILKVWDYECKVAMVRRTFSTNKIQCITYDPEGLYLAIGFTSGAVQVLDTCNLQSEENNSFQYTQDCITHLTFSHDTSYLATADTGKAVTVFYLCKKESPHVWKYLGRYCSHFKPIQDLLFGVCLDNSKPRLLSLGMDRKLVEYDLLNSKKDELLILSSKRIEQNAVPTCMAWYPHLTTEEFLLIASDQHKMKLLNVTTKMCRKTVLGPTYGSPVTKMQILPCYKDGNPGSYYMAYITEDKVGLQILPLDGNPYKSSAVICHAQGVSSLTCSNDGRYIFTAGGEDMSVFCWEISIPALEAAAALGGKDLVPFYTLLEGGRDGELFKAIEDIFYYCQLCNQGIDSMETRKVSTFIPLSDVPNIIRALGVYLSEQELEDMHNEVKFSQYAETEKYVTEIDLNDFIKLYINHRPDSDISVQELDDAFQLLGVPNQDGKPVITREELLELLQAKGEHMTKVELLECFTTLLDLQMTGEGCTTMDVLNCKDSSLLLKGVLPPDITMDMFATEVLGFPISPTEVPSVQHSSSLTAPKIFSETV